MHTDTAIRRLAEEAVGGSAPKALADAATAGRTGEMPVVGGRP